MVGLDWARATDETKSANAIATFFIEVFAPPDADLNTRPPVGQVIYVTGEHALLDLSAERGRAAIENYQFGCPRCAAMGRDEVRSKLGSNEDPSRRVRDRGVVL